MGNMKHEVNKGVAAGVNFGIKVLIYRNEGNNE